jgi:hypothetical protein
VWGTPALDASIHLGHPLVEEGTSSLLEVVFLLTATALGASPSRCKSLGAFSVVQITMHRILTVSLSL